MIKLEINVDVDEDKLKEWLASDVVILWARAYGPASIAYKTALCTKNSGYGMHPEPSYMLE